MLPEIPPPLAGALADAPLALVLLWMVVQLRRDLAVKADPPAPPSPAPRSQAADPTREDLSAFKLEVARTYVPLSLIRDLDTRLTQQLGRLEAKLDEVSHAATTAATLAGHPLPGRALGFRPRGGEPQP